MLTQIIRADDLFAVISSPTSSNEEKLNLIMNLKAHVKRDFVDIFQVPKYLETLSIAIDISDYNILSNSWSALCHMIKRVNIQDKSGKVLKDQSFIVLPIIINKLGDNKSSIKASARKALEGYWLSASRKVEESVMDIGFGHSNKKVVHESVSWLDHIIVNINPHFKLDAFVPSLVRILRNYSNDQEIVDTTRLLLIHYYNMKHNRLYKFDLQSELDSQNVSKNIQTSILNEIDFTTAELSIQKRKLQSQIYHQSSSRSPSGQSEIKQNTTQALSIEDHRGESVKNTAMKNREESNANLNVSHLPSNSFKPLSRPSSRSSLNISQNTQSQHDHHNHNANISSKLSESISSSEIASSDSTNDDAELNRIISKIPNYALDTSVKDQNCMDSNDLYNKFASISLAFEGKETEFNWRARELGIITLRSIIRGNAHLEFIDDLQICLRDSSDGICKAVSSLRTTLSSNGCQFVKELALYLKKSFDSLTDLFLPTLIKLCSATKNIASTHANMAISIIFLNISFSSKYVSKILSSVNEKNVSPRSYSGLWLQIILTRFHKSPMFYSTIDVSKKILAKLLSDPNPTVRQVARDTYWCFWSKFKTEAESVLSKFDSNVIKGVERSRPKNLQSSSSSMTPSLAPKKSRPSIKEAIMAKNKELRSKQLEQGIGSRPSSRVTSRSSIDNFDKELNRKPSRSISEANKRVSRTIGAPKRAGSTSSLNAKADPPSNNTDHGRRNESFLSNPSMNSTPSSGNYANNGEQRNSTSKPDTNSHHQSSFDKQNDPILKFLSSNRPELVEEGVHLLRYAIMGDEDLSNETSSLLKKISIENPILLKPLFLEGENLFRKSYKFFEAEDFLRTCSLVIPPSDRNVQIIISLMDVDEVYESISKILSYVTNYFNIVDDDELTMQIIKYKSQIVAMLIEFLSKCTDKIPINDGQFVKLVTILFDLVDLLRSTDAYSSFGILLNKLYYINPSLFSNELKMMNETSREDIESIVGIKKVIDLSTNFANLSSSNELTRVVPGQEINLSPLKGTSDLTKLIPSRRAGPDSTIVFVRQKSSNSLNTNSDIMIDDIKSVDLDAEPDFDKEVEDNIDIDEDDEHLHTFHGDDAHESADPGQDDEDLDEAIDEDINIVVNVSEHDNHSYDEADDDAHEGPLASMVIHSPPHGQQQASGSSQSSKILSSDEQHNKLSEVKGDISKKRDEISKDSSLAKQGSGHASNLMVRFNQSDSAELVEDFAQVKITELKNQLNDNNVFQEFIDSPKFHGQQLSAKSSIQTFIDKVDPLNKISSRSKPINIFQDDNDGSPQKVKDYSYSERNWFNFQVTKTAEEIDSNSDLCFSTEKFEELCHKLCYQANEKVNFVTLLAYLKTIHSTDSTNYYEQTGQHILEDSLWHFFDKLDEIPQKSLQYGLVILKQTLINRTKVNLSKLWCLLVELSKSIDRLDDLSEAISEIYNEALCGIYSSKNLLFQALGSLKSQSIHENKNSLLFIIECLSKLIGMGTFNLLIDDSLITQIDSALCDLINHDDQGIRACVILNYGKLLKASRTVHLSDMNKVDTPTEKDRMETVVQKFSIPQQKLVQYYSQD